MGRARIALAVVVAWLAWSAAPALATTYTVTNTGDSGAGSLRAAIVSANNDPGSTIVFAPGVSGFVDVLSPLAITQSVTIEGPGASTFELDGNGGQTQIMTVASSANVAISGLRFAFGFAAVQGGAIANSGTLSISNATFDHDVAGGPASSSVSQGGAIYSAGTLTVADSTFTDNAAGGAGGAATGSGIGEGGAIFSDGPSTLTVRGSTFARNAAGGDAGSGQDSGEGDGGAIAIVGSSSLMLADSTLTQNKAGGSDGGVFLDGLGEGGAVFSDAMATLQSDTIDANVLGPAQGASGAGVFNQGTLTVAGTIVSGNTGAGNCNAAVTSSSFSLEGPAGQTSCGFDRPSADPLLGALADNGGPTETQSLGAGSPAIGAVASAGDCLATDQRGALRPQGGCDAGAYEVAPPVVAGASAVSVGSTTASLDASVVNPDVFPGTVSFQYGPSTAYGSETATQALPAGAPGGVFSASLSGLAPGTVYHYRVVASDPDGTTFGADQQFTTASPTPPLSPPSQPSQPSQPSNAFTLGKPKVGPGGAIALAVDAPDAGRFTAKAMFTVITRKGHKRVKRTFLYGTASLQSTGRGRFRLVIGLRGRAAGELKLLGSRHVTITVTFTPSGGSARHKTKNVTVKRNRKGKYS
jgi:hypothetical protein